MLPPLPIPPASWLEAVNARLHQARVEPRAREFKAFEQWAAEHGQPDQFGALALSHLGTPAWRAIHAYFHNHTGAGQENAEPYLLTCFFYDEAFWPLHVGLVLGEDAVDPIRFLKEVPASLIHRLGHDASARDGLDRHWFDCFDHLTGMDAVVGKGTLAYPKTREFLEGADGMLASAAVTLMGGQPNPKAAEHARFAFESALKALLVERGGMTEPEVKKQISHHLDRLPARCQPLLDPADHVRLDAAWGSFPDVGARYDNAALPREQLWACYREGRYAAATVLRALGGPDSRGNLPVPAPVVP